MVWIVKYWNVEILKCWDFEMLKYWNIECCDLKNEVKKEMQTNKQTNNNKHKTNTIETLDWGYPQSEMTLQTVKPFIAQPGKTVKPEKVKWE